MIVGLSFRDLAPGIALRGGPFALRQLAGHVRDLAVHVVVPVRTGDIELRLFAGEPLFIGLRHGVLSLSDGGDVMDGLVQILEALAGEAEAAGSGAQVPQTADVRRAVLLGRALSEQELTTLLDVLCTELGHCLPADVRQRLVAVAPDDVDAFVDAVLLSEGLDPLTYDRRAGSQVRRRVAAAFQRERQRRDAL